MPTKNEIELYMQGFVIIDCEGGRYYWGIDNKGAHGASSFGAQPDGGVYPEEYRKGAHATEKDAMAAAIRYIWANRPDIVATAQREAYEAERYRGKA